MSDINEKVRSFYSLDDLPPLNPKDNDEMAAMIIGTYTINAGARKKVEELASHLEFAREEYKPYWIDILDSVESSRNLNAITDLIGRRALQVIDISDGAEPITRYHGDHALNEAHGVIGKDERGRPWIDANRNNQIRLSLSRRPYDHRRYNDWYFATIVDEDSFKPLVELNVADSLRSFR